MPPLPGSVLLAGSRLVHVRPQMGTDAFCSQRVVVRLACQYGLTLQDGRLNGHLTPPDFRRVAFRMAVVRTRFARFPQL